MLSRFDIDTTTTTSTDILRKHKSVALLFLPTTTGLPPSSGSVLDNFLADFLKQLNVLATQPDGIVTTVQSYTVYDNKISTFDSLTPWQQDQVRQDTTVQQMAQLIVADIKEAKIKGPCIFFCYSSAGYLALEIEKILKQDATNKVMPYFILIDTMPPEKTQSLSVGEIKESIVSILNVIATSELFQSKLPLAVKTQLLTTLADSVHESPGENWVDILADLTKAVVELQLQDSEYQEGFDTLKNYLNFVVIPNFHAVFEYAPSQIPTNPGNFSLVVADGSREESAMWPTNFATETFVIPGTTHSSIIGTQAFVERFSEVFCRGFSRLLQQKINRLSEELSKLCSQFSLFEQTTPPAPIPTIMGRDALRSSNHQRRCPSPLLQHPKTEVVHT